VARIPRYSAKEPVPIKQPVLVSPGDFPFSTAEAQTVGAIGDILTELGKRKVDMQNKLGLSNVDAAMEEAEIGYNTIAPQTPLEKRPELLRKYINFAMSSLGQQRFTPEARKLAENKLKIWSETLQVKAAAQDIKDLGRETTARLSDAYMQALIKGDPVGIEEKKAMLADHLADVMTPTEAKLYMQNLEGDALKQRKQNIIQQLENRAATDPQAIIDAIDEELRLKDRKRGNPEFASLENTDLVTLKKYANGIISQRQNISEQNREAAIENAYAQMLQAHKLGQPIDLIQLITDVQNNPDISDKDSNIFATKIISFFETLTTGRLQDDPYVLAETTQKVAENKITDAQIRDLYGHGLSPITGEKIIAQRGRLYENHYYKEAENYLRIAFGWSANQGFVDTMTGRTSGPYYQAARNDWISWIEKNEDRIEGGQIKPEEIVRQAKIISGPYLAKYLYEEKALSLEDIIETIDLSTGMEWGGPLQNLRPITTAPAAEEQPPTTEQQPPSAKQGQRVKMQAPDGKLYWVDESEAEEAKKHGWKITK